jgi:hypothetical protein
MRRRSVILTGALIALTLATALSLANEATATATAAPRRPLTAAAQQPAEAGFVYVSANRVMEYDAVAETSTVITYIEEGTPIMPSRALGGTAVSWSVRSLSGPLKTYVRETSSTPGEATMHVFTADLFTFPRLSPDGTKLLYIAEEPDPQGGLTNNLHVRRVADGTELFSIADVDAADWSPDGTKIVFASYPRARFDPDLVTLYVYDVETATETRMPAVRIAAIGEINTYSPRWSPSGEWIAHQRYVHDAVEIVVTDAAGATTEVLHTLPLAQSGQGLEWVRMPDGTERLFTDSREPSGSPYVIVEVPGPDGGSQETRILHGAFFGQAQPDFSDVTAEHHSYRQIRDLASLRVIRGFDDGSFGPQKLVTRQQFAKMIVKTLGLTVTGTETSPFTDVARGLDETDPFYPDKYVAVCAAAGITAGKTPTKFAPYDNMTRAQLITMVARAAGLPEPPAGYAPPFGDFSDDHYPWARRAAHAGLLEGLPGMGGGYDFWAPATRAEVCVVLWNLLQR